LAAKTPGEVRACLGCGLKLAAERAEKPQNAVCGPAGEEKDALDEMVDGDSVSDREKLVA